MTISDYKERSLIFCEITCAAAEYGELMTPLPMPRNPEHQLIFMEAELLSNIREARKELKGC